MKYTLAHAKTLAAEFVIRNGQEFPKTAEFTDEQQAAEDWEPSPRVTVEQVAEDLTNGYDCGCDGQPKVSPEAPPAGIPVEPPSTEIPTQGVAGAK